MTCFSFMHFLVIPSFIITLLLFENIDKKSNKLLMSVQHGSLYISTAWFVRFYINTVYGYMSNLDKKSNKLLMRENQAN